MAHAHTHVCIPSQPDANGALAPVPGYLTEQIHHVLRHHQDDPIPSVEVIEYAELIDSCDMGPLQWRQVAQDIHKHYEVFDGFVVIMGTDTLAYTASALSFMFENLGKTVIITGSQVPIARINSDARRNLLFALHSRARWIYPRSALSSTRSFCAVCGAVRKIQAILLLSPPHLCPP